MNIQFTNGEISKFEFKDLFDADKNYLLKFSENPPRAKVTVFQLKQLGVIPQNKYMENNRDSHIDKKVWEEKNKHQEKYGTWGTKNPFKVKDTSEAFQLRQESLKKCGLI